MRSLFVAVLLALSPVAAGAQAMYAPFMANGGAGGSITGIIKPTIYYWGQTKPQGMIEVNPQHWMAPMVSVYDRGDGFYINGAPGNSVQNFYASQQYNGVTCELTAKSTAYGTAGLWPGLCITNHDTGNNFTGLGTYVEVGVGNSDVAASGLPINTVSGLSALGAGAGYSAAVQFIRNTATGVNADYEQYAGRTWISSGEQWQSASGPGMLWGFAEDFGADNTHKCGELCVGGYITTSGPTQSVVGQTTVTPGLFYNLGLDCQNVTSGSANCDYIVNGAVTANALTGVAAQTTLSSNETMIQIGATWHRTGLSNHTPSAFIFKHDFWARKLNVSEWAWYATNPWGFYRPKGAI